MSMLILQDEAINYSDSYFFLSQKINKKSVPKACLIKRASIWPSEALRLWHFGL